MKKILYFTLIISFFGCYDDVQNNNCFQNFLPPITLELNNPQLNKVLTPGGSTFIEGGLSQILLYNQNGRTFKAFDTKCPNNDCDTQMTFNGLTLKCPCDKSEYSILDGSLQKGKSNCPAREYTVSKNGSILRITN